MGACLAIPVAVVLLTTGQYASGRPGPSDAAASDFVPPVLEIPPPTMLPPAAATEAAPALPWPSGPRGSTAPNLAQRRPAALCFIRRTLVVSPAEPALVVLVRRTLGRLCAAVPQQHAGQSAAATPGSASPVLGGSLSLRSRTGLSLRRAVKLPRGRQSRRLAVSALPTR